MYSHTQPGSLLRIALLISLFIFLLFAWVIQRDTESFEDDPETIIVIVFASFLMIVLLSLFHSLTVEEDNDSLTVKFGIGLISKRISFKQIQLCETVTMPWWRGLGIKKIPGGWMYNIAGRDAVELTMNNGDKFLIGTNEPEVLTSMIRNRIITASDKDERWI